MENFKKFELTTVWKKQVTGGFNPRANSLRMINLAGKMPEPTIYIFVQEEKKKKFFGAQWITVPKMFRK